jgi:hypothetical protein
VLEADEQERREAGQLPEDEQQQDVVAQDDAKHRAHEGEERGVERAGLRMAVKIAARVEDHERPDARDHHREQQPESVEIERQRQAQRRRPRALDDVGSAGQDRAELGTEHHREQRGPQREQTRRARVTRDEPRGQRRHQER